MTQPQASSPWKNRLMTAFLATGVGYVAASYLAARTLTRRRRRRPEASPIHLGVTWETLTCLTADGLRLTGWLVEPLSPRGTVALFHGLGRNRDQLLDRIAVFVEAGFRCVAFDHRAHGESEGTRTSFGYHEGRDVEAVLRLLEERWPEGPRIALGISMGAAAVCFGAAHACRADAIILESMYHDIESALNSRMKDGFPAWYRSLRPGLVWFTERRLGLRMRDMAPAEHVGRLAPAPVLLLTGSADLHAPPEDTHRLSQRCSGPYEVAFVDGAHHGNLLEVAGSSYRDQVLGFLERWLPTREPAYGPRR